jgi:hypothetical protein
MMREILGVAQDASGVQRRWFHDDYFDLFVWQTDQGETTSFQLCYGVDSNEQALEWRQDQGWFQDGNAAVDPEPPKAARAAHAPADSIASRFESAAEALPNAIRTAVAARLREYAERAAVTARRSKVRRAAWQRNKPGSD